MRSEAQLQELLKDQELFTALYRALVPDDRYEDGWERYREIGCEDEPLRGSIGQLFAEAKPPAGLFLWGGPRCHLRWRGELYETPETVALARLLLRLPYPQLGGMIIAADDAPMAETPHLVPLDPAQRPFAVLHRVLGSQGAEGQSRFYGLENALYYCAALRARVNFPGGGYLKLEEHRPDQDPVLLAQGWEGGLVFFFRGAKPYALPITWSPSYEQISDHVHAALAGEDLPPPGGGVPDLRPHARRLRHDARR